MIAFTILALAFFGSIYIFYKILNHLCNRKNHFRIMYNSESYCYYVQKKLWGAWWHWNVLGNCLSFDKNEWVKTQSCHMETLLDNCCINVKQIEKEIIIKEIYGDIKN